MIYKLTTHSEVQTQYRGFTFAKPLKVNLKYSNGFNISDELVLLYREWGSSLQRPGDWALIEAWNPVNESDASVLNYFLFSRIDDCVLAKLMFGGKVTELDYDSISHYIGQAGY